MQQRFWHVLPATLIPSIFFSLTEPVLGQFLPPSSADFNLTTIYSPINRNITISYKTPPIGTCTTVFSTQKQFTGYVSLPPHTLALIQQNYSINTFFWFIEARSKPETAPLTIYINGGPGSSSMVGLFQETGPCQVVEMAKGMLGTQPRQWGWDRSSNVLFIDQPDQVGFSYDTRTNGSLNLFTGEFAVPPAPIPFNQPNDSFLNGTFSSGNGNSTANTTAIAARTIWHMLQGFLGAFPQYNPGSLPNGTTNGMVGVNLFTESYGGHFGPSFAAFWEEQNMRRKNGTIPSNGTLDIRLSSVGILQGCIDDLVQAPFYPLFAYNNTYGIQAISLTDQQTAANSFLSANGCQQQIQTCRSAVGMMDPQDDGDVANVNQICQSAQTNCNSQIQGPYYQSGRGPYDITHKLPDSFPPSFYLDYLNAADVQAGVGAMVNYTESNPVVQKAFLQTGDYERGNQVAQISYLLSLGVRVALIYGDRDYVCNWAGGEAVAYSIAAQSISYSPFYTAAYADIVVNSSYIGGVVRQYGNFSFSRVYDAGHLIPAYQPETAFTIFTRIIMGTDIATGKPVNLSNFSTHGNANATHTNSAPASPDPTCWIRNIANTCTNDQKNMIQQGQGVIINGVHYDKESDWQAPASSISVQAGVPGTVPTLMTANTVAPSGSTSYTASTTGTVPTGVYVATGTITATKNGVASPTQEASIPFMMAAGLTVAAIVELYI